jgi:hypothetical protein
MGRESRETWSKRVERWKASGLTAVEFAAQLGIKPSSLSWWKWQLGKSVGARRSSRPVRSKRAVTTTTVSPLTFVEMSAPLHGDPLEVVLRGGVRVRVPVNFDAAALGRLLDVLDARR